MKNFEELAKLIVKAVAAFDPVVRAAGCGCNIPHKYDLTETRRIYAELSSEFGLDGDMSYIVAGQCTGAPIEDLVCRCARKNGISGFNVWVQGGAIVLHHAPVPEYEAMKVAISKLTEQEVCTGNEMGERQYALEKEKKKIKS